jgi:glycerate dehydrogenase
MQAHPQKLRIWELTDNTMKTHYAVMLDEATFTSGDLNLSALVNQVDQWDRYPTTTAAQRFERLQNASIVLANKVRLDAQLLSALPKLQLILLTGTGTDHIDLAICKAQGITVCNVASYGTSSIAQHVFTLMLALSTNLLSYARDTASGAWSQGAHLLTLAYPISELEGKSLGLVGYGTLAKGVEKLALAFGMNVVIAQRPGGALQSGRLPMDTLLAESDVVSLHCPLVDSTYHLINAAALRKMKATAILINTARGAVVDNVALAEALKSGEIKGAGIDVLEQEPPPVDHPLIQSDVPNIIVTPHIAWGSVEARQRLLNKVAENLQAWLKGDPVNVVS